VPGAEEDGVFLAQMSLTQLRCGEKDIKFYNDGAYPKTDLLSDLRGLAAKMQRGDRLMIFWIGRGIGGDNGEPLFLLPTIDPSSEESIRASSISVDELMTAIDSRRPPQEAEVYIFLDTVHESAFDGHAFVGPQAVDFNGYDVRVLSATSDDQPSKPSLFATTLIDAFKGVADQHGLAPDGVITAHEVAQYVEQTLSEREMQPTWIGDWGDQALRTYDVTTRQDTPTTEWVAPEIEFPTKPKVKATSVAFRFGALGVGGMIAISGMVMHGNALDLWDDLSEDPEQNFSGPAAYDDAVRRYKLQRSLTFGLYALGGATISAGFIHIAVVHPTGISVQGRF